MVGERMMFTAFLILSLVSALTEGLTISLLAPLLQAQGPNTSIVGVPGAGLLLESLQPFDMSSRIRIIAGLLAGLLLIRGVVQYALESVTQLMPMRIQKTLSLRAYHALLALKLSYFNQQAAGVLMTNVKGLPDRISLLLTYFAMMVSSLILLAAYGALMFAISWRMTLMATLLVLLISFVLKKLSATSLRKIGQEITETSNQLSQTLHETITGMKQIHLSVAENLMRARYRGNIEANYRGLRRFVMIAATSSPFLTTTAGIFICLLLVGSSLVHQSDDQHWLGTILLFVVVLFRTLAPVSQINNSRNRILGDLHAFETLQEFFKDAEIHQQILGNRPFTKLRTGIAFDRVTFTYESGKEPVLQNFSLFIPQGQLIAIVGPSGAGKSTLVGLLSQMYAPQQGNILVDDVSLTDLKPEDWRLRISVVSQDIFLFNDTVTNNLCFGLSEIPFDRVRQAAQLASADEFIEKMPEGYDTMLGDRGVRLSGGQQQRIAIARAIIANPDLLILDEATSHLDTLTERAIQTAVEALSADRTLLVIAHRLSTVRKADKVIVMKDGRIVEEGRHEELLRNKGIYWQMIEQQRLDLVEDEVGA